jgi:hypothetical protein
MSVQCVGINGFLAQNHINFILQIDFGYDNPRNIAYHLEARSFAVACIRHYPTRIGDPPRVTTSLIKLLDDTSYRGKRSHKSGRVY